ncbi:MAG: hypothetical protein IKZ20_07405, partial [Bacteroidaceae bacterium]|nr:hypothetical protein [Bacteroidaceae bacterium]
AQKKQAAMANRPADLNFRLRTDCFIGVFILFVFTYQSLGEAIQHLHAHLRPILRLSFCVSRQIYNDIF